MTSFPDAGRTAVPLRFFLNTMRMTIITSFCALLILNAMSCSKPESDDNGQQAGNEIPEEIAGLPDTLRIGSYNLRVTADSGVNSWEERKTRLVESIIDNDFDIFGVQEADVTIQSELPQLLAAAGADYGYRFFSPYNQSGTGDKAQGIFYKKSVLSLERWNFYWVSDTPDESTVNDTGSSGDYRRGACWAIMKDLRRNDLRFFFMVSHGHLNSGTNSKYAYVYEEQEKRYNTEGLPSIFVGDLNATPTSATYSELRGHWDDTFIWLSNDKKTGPTGTYNGFDHNKDMESARRIDYIFFRGDGIEPLNYVCNDALYDGEFASDHFPIYSDMKISPVTTWY